jgi:hypothetical protein
LRTKKIPFWGKKKIPLKVLLLYTLWFWKKGMQNKNLNMIF